MTPSILTDYIHDTIEALQGGISVSRAFEQALNEYHELLASKSLPTQESIDEILEELEDHFEFEDNFYSLKLDNIDCPDFLSRDMSCAKDLVDKFYKAVSALSEQHCV